MWKQREEPTQPAESQLTGGIGASKEGSRADGNVIIGKSIVVKGELSGAEPLTIEGTVEGKVTLKQHLLTIGTHGRIRAQVFAKSIVVLGEVVGNIEATEKVAIHDEGAVEGDIKAPRVSIAEGAKFRGGIDMQQGQGQQQGQQQPGPGPGPRQSAGPSPTRTRNEPKPGLEPREPRRSVPSAKAKSA